MAWIESHQTLGNHPKTHRLAQELGCDLPAAVGYLHFFWWWALDYAPAGNVSRDHSGLIATASHWHGQAKRFWNALETAGFLEINGPDSEEFLIHDWNDYAGRLETQREMRRASNRDAQRRRREKAASSLSSPVSNDADDRQHPTVPNLTGPNQTAAAAARSTPARARTRGKPTLSADLQAEHERYLARERAAGAAAAAANSISSNGGGRG
jgi:hypothetical protein